MNINRFGTGEQAGALISQGVVHGDTIILSGVTARDLGGDVAAQTRDALDQIEALLAEGGSDRDHVLMVHVWLSDMSRFQDMNAVWKDWVEPQLPRACRCFNRNKGGPSRLVADAGKPLLLCCFELRR